MGQVAVIAKAPARPGSPTTFAPAVDPAGYPPTPTLRFDCRVVQARYRLLARGLPGVELHYAVKANPRPEVLRCLAVLGARWDVASPGKIDAVLAVDPGLHAVARVAAVRRPMTVAVIDNFLYGYLVVAIVLLAQDTFRGDGGGGADRGPGLFNAALSVGGVLALLPGNALAARYRPATLLMVSMTGFASVTIALGLSGSVVLSVALVGFAGGTSLLAEVMSVTQLQRAAPDDLTARVFGVYDQLNVGALAIGSLIAGPLADALGTGTAVVVVGSVCLVLAAVATGRLREPVRRGRHAAVRPNLSRAA